LQLRSSAELAERRTANAARIDWLLAELHKQPAISSKDPGSDNLSRALRGWITPELFNVFRTIWLGIVTAFPGFLFGFSRLLASKRKKSPTPE
jgi:hypothetical protein